MRNVSSVAMAVAGLLVSGSVLAALDLSQPEKPFWEWTPSVVIALCGALIALVGAIATFRAAEAARRAAEHSSKQSKELENNNRWQRYLQHQEQFVGMLREIEGYVPVTFLGSTELYNELFTDNSRMEKPFSFKADPKATKAISDGIADLIKSGRKYVTENPSDASIKAWLGKFTFFCVSTLWIQLGELGDDALAFKGVTSGISEKTCGDMCYASTYVAYRLLNFCGAADDFHKFEEDEVFNQVILDFIVRHRAASGATGPAGLV